MANNTHLDSSIDFGSYLYLSYFNVDRSIYLSVYNQINICNLQLNSKYLITDDQFVCIYNNNIPFTNYERVI